MDLGRIACPLNLLAGAHRPHHAARPGLRRWPTQVSTPARDVVKRVTSGGHLGLFMGREALREHWPPILAGVLERSRARAGRPARRRRARAATRRAGGPIPAP